MKHPRYAGMITEAQQLYDELMAPPEKAGGAKPTFVRSRTRDTRGMQLVDRMREESLP